MSTPLYQRIQQFYDASSGLWEQIWGEHMHHGYYGPGGKLRKDRRIAQIDLIEELLAWAGVEQADCIVDVGCGIGGSSLYLAAKYGAQVDGVTLSPVQAARATARSREAGFGDRARFQVADALHLPFADDTFDLVWSLESGEHMPDKAAFLQECYRVLKPGGVFILATWCHRPIDGVPLSADEERHLKEIYDVYHLPYVISLPEYEAIARSLPFQELRTADWSAEVAPFWDRVIESALNPLAMVGLLASGWETIRGAMALGLMSQGFERGLIRYGLLRATK